MINISFQFGRKTAAKIKKEVSHKLPVHLLRLRKKPRHSKTKVEAINTNKSTATAVCRFRCWCEGKQLKEITRQEAATTVKVIHFRN